MLNLSEDDYRSWDKAEALSETAAALKELTLPRSMGVILTGQIKEYLKGHPGEEERAKQFAVWQKKAKGKQRTGMLLTVSVLLVAALGGGYLFGYKPYVERQAWEVANQRNTISAYRQYNEKFPNGEFSEAVPVRIDNIRWAEAEKNDNLEGYTEYLDYSGYKYPENVAAAKGKFDAFAWVAAEEANTLEAFEAYRTEFPEGLHIERVNGAIATISQRQELGDLKACLQKFKRQDFDLGFSSLDAASEKIGAYDYSIFPYLNGTEESCGLKVKDEGVFLGDLLLLPKDGFYVAEKPIFHLFGASPSGDWAVILMTTSSFEGVGIAVINPDLQIWNVHSVKVSSPWLEWSPNEDILLASGFSHTRHSIIKFDLNGFYGGNLSIGGPPETGFASFEHLGPYIAKMIFKLDQLTWDDEYNFSVPLLYKINPRGEFSDHLDSSERRVLFSRNVQAPYRKTCDDSVPSINWITDDMSHCGFSFTEAEGVRFEDKQIDFLPNGGRDSAAQFISETMWTDMARRYRFIRYPPVNNLEIFAIDTGEGFFGPYIYDPGQNRHLEIGCNKYWSGQFLGVSPEKKHILFAGHQEGHQVICGANLDEWTVVQSFWKPIIHGSDTVSGILGWDSDRDFKLEVEIGNQYDAEPSEPYYWPFKIEDNEFVEISSPKRIASILNGMNATQGWWRSGTEIGFTITDRESQMLGYSEPRFDSDPIVNCKLPYLAQYHPRNLRRMVEDDLDFITISPETSIELLRPVSLDVESWALDREQISLKRGDRLRYLDSTGEGFMLVEQSGFTHKIDGSQLNEDNSRTIQAVGLSEHWVQVTCEDSGRAWLSYEQIQNEPGIGPTWPSENNDYSDLSIEELYELLQTVTSE